MQLPGHFLITLFSLVSLVTSQDCNSFLACDECISSPLIVCVWCANKVYAEQYYPSCDTAAALKDRGCPDSDVISAESVFIASDSSMGVNPTRVVATLPPTVRKTFEIKVSPPPPAVYPVDIYILFDNTQSMSPYVTVALNVTAGLLSFAKNLSTTSRVGFGTFVEKETIPFHFNQDDDPLFPGVSHAFQNVLPLTSNKTLVLDLVTVLADLGTNDDNPEGVLEAVLQSISCPDEIQWREPFRSYRMVVVMTDSEFHYALDGKLAGIVQPNNLQCSLEDGTYVNSGSQDYPSILQFLTRIVEENILPVVITDGDLRSLYEELLSIIEIDGTVIPLTTDLTILESLIEDIYLEASTSSHPFILPENDVIQYELTLKDCGGGELMAETKSCHKIPKNSSATYELEVWLSPEQACSSGHGHPHGLDVRFRGFGVVNVTLSPFCQCACSTRPEEQSGKCNSNGDLVCGVCQCSEGYSGPNCECQVNSSRACVEPGTNVACSNKGICECGGCICDTPTTFGNYCHCDHGLCPVYDGEVCGGPDRGTCSCLGTCTCTPKYEDGAQGQCSCLKTEHQEAKDACTDPQNSLNVLCNGHGTCECAQCVCDAGKNIEDPDYEGMYCEICNVCMKSCDVLRTCLVCLISTGSETCCPGSAGESLRLSVANDTQFALLLTDPDYRTCYLFDQSDCIWDYAIASIYTGEEENIEVFARRRLCDSATWWPWLVLAFFIVVVAGVVIIIGIRLFVYMLERQEFNAFWKSTQEKMSLPFTNSPLYMPPVTEVTNPSYKKTELKNIE